MTRPTHPSDPPRIHSFLGGGPAAWSEAGAGPAVVMVPGMPGSGRDFRWLAPALLPDHHVVRPDLPGFGGTPMAARAPGVRGMAGHVVALLKALDLRDVTLVGHSFGTVVAIEAALQAPDRVARLALISPIGLRAHRGFRQMLPPRLFAPALAVPGVGDALQRLMHYGARRAGFPARTQPVELAQTMRHLAHFDFPTHRRAVDRLRLPTLVAWCLDDPLIEPAVVEELLPRLPAGPRLRFTDGGHNPQKAHAVEIAEALRRFAASPGGAAQSQGR